MLSFFTFLPIRKLENCIFHVCSLKTCIIQFSSLIQTLIRLYQTSKTKDGTDSVLI